MQPFHDWLNNLSTLARNFLNKHPLNRLCELCCGCLRVDVLRRLHTIISAAT